MAKGRDTGVSQVTGFTAKISMGNGMQVTVIAVVTVQFQLLFHLVVVVIVFWL